MITIDLIPHNQLIQITTSSLEIEWTRIRRYFFENAAEVEAPSATSIRMPAWSFLAHRQGFGVILQQSRIEFNLAPAANELLQRAARTDRQFENTAFEDPVDESLILERLHAAGFTRKLTTFQLRNVCKLAMLPAGATFSVPGAGKTTEALAYYCLNREMGDRLLVAAPKNAFAAWEEQLELCFAKPPRPVRLVGGRENIERLLLDDPQVMLITYQQLPIVQSVLGNHMLRHPTFMYLDESHKVKAGHRGVQGSAVLALAHLPERKLILSGTPLPNSTRDLVPQFEYLFPEIKVDEHDVRQKIARIFVRTTKPELGLPPVERRHVPVGMRERQRQLYNLMRDEQARQLSGLNLADRSLLRHAGRSVVRLLQVTSNPALLAKQDTDFPTQLRDVLREGDGPKIEYACNRARQLARRGQKVIIWSNFVENVEIICSRLADLGADFIHGGVDAGSEEEEDTREFKIKRFHDDPNSSVLVANPAACAEGISLHTVCHNAIYVDRNYNAAQYLQSEDRIHRLGLSPSTSTLVEILYTPDSIDESVNRRLTAKVQRMAAILEDHSLNIEPVEVDLDHDGLDSDDIRDLLQHLRPNSGSDGLPL